MWNYEKRLEFPVNIKNTNPKMAQMIISQYGGTYTICYVFTLKKFAPSNRSE